MQWYEMTNDRSSKAKQFLDNVKSGKIKNLHTTIYKEKRMETRVIFESEEEFYRFCTDCGIDAEVVGRVKRAGYIRKNPVEEAEEHYIQWDYNHKNNIENGWSNTIAVLYELYEAIQYQKSEIEALKNGNYNKQ